MSETMHLSLQLTYVGGDVNSNTYTHINKYIYLAYICMHLYTNTHGQIYMQMYSKYVNTYTVLANAHAIILTWLTVWKADMKHPSIKPI